jgi:hypothetical protein
MTRRTVVLGTLTALVAFRARPSFAEEAFERSPDPRLRIEWQKGTTKKGKPLVSGYVFNSYGMTAGNIRIMVEGLDPAGTVVHKDVRWVLGTVANDDRLYFEVTVPEAASYRVRLLAWDWQGRGGQ